MKILYDHQTFTWQEFGGISRYSTELITNIPKFDTFEPVLPNIFSNNSNLDAFQIKHRHFFKNIQIRNFLLSENGVARAYHYNVG